MGRTACTEPQCLNSTAIPLLPSVPVQYSYTSTHPMGRTACTEPQCLNSTAIPLLPLWAVLPVQSLSACTVQLYLYSPYGPYGCTEPQCLNSTAIPLLHLWAVRTVQSLSACTRVHFNCFLLFLKPNHPSYLSAYDDGTVFRNVGR